MDKTRDTGLGIKGGIKKMKKLLTILGIITAMFVLTACGEYTMDFHINAYEEQQDMKVNITAEDTTTTTMLYNMMKPEFSKDDGFEMYRRQNSIIATGPINGTIDVEISQSGNWFKTTYITTVEESGFEKFLDGGMGETIYIYTEGKPQDVTENCDIEKGVTKCYSLPTTITSTCYLFWCN